MAAGWGDNRRGGMEELGQVRILSMIWDPVQDHDDPGGYSTGWSLRHQEKLSGIMTAWLTYLGYTSWSARLYTALVLDMWPMPGMKHVTVDICDGARLLLYGASAVVSMVKDELVAQNARRKQHGIWWRLLGKSGILLRRPILS